MPISKRNRRAVLGLLMLTILISFVPRLFSPIAGSSTQADISFSELKLAENDIEARQEVWTKKRSYGSKKKSYGKKFKRPKFKFDPNSYESKDWMALGLSVKQADIIVKLSVRGFRSNEDLERIYVLPKEAFDLLKDSTFFPARNHQKFTPNQANSVTRKKILVDLNTGNQADFEEIPGIGEYFAKKIIDYRGQLGGFISKEQLMEVWKIDAVKYAEMERFVELDTKSIEKISVNTATAEQLQKHPYINYKVANSLVKMRDQHGAYKELSDIKRSMLIDEVLYQKIKPYLSL